jgi:hypothetical protein
MAKKIKTYPMTLPSGRTVRVTVPPRGDELALPFEKDRAERLAKVATRVVSWINDDWDRPDIHALRDAIGMEEKDQEKAAKLIRSDLVALIDLMRPRRSPVTVEELAREFSSVLKKWLTKKEFREVIRRNDAESNPSICHSHDFCDANMAMVAAFENLNLETPDDEQGEASFRLWNEAWNMAVKNRFYMKGRV